MLAAATFVVVLLVATRRDDPVQPDDTVVPIEPAGTDADIDPIPETDEP